MAIPRAFLDDLTARTSVSRVIGQFVTWDSRKSRPANGDYWACCPFHREKTPSFHVTESRSTYYCFGCQATGNAFTFLEKHRNMNFRQSVEFLAGLAGMVVPEEKPPDREMANHHARLLKLLERADRYFRRCLHDSPGRPALEYIRDRGFRPETLEYFGVGYAPKGDALLRMCRTEGYTDKHLVEAGLARERDEDSGVYPVFRDRLMIPITDLRGRTIAFGGRAMQDRVPAKYLNSPATALFNKSTVLFNHQTAQSPSAQAERLVVTEGYLDVMALHEAGLVRTVAPLGTAITDSHLQQLWQMHPTPILCLDGDEAGRRAANRAMHLALPLLKPGYSLEFCILPDGLDPDDLIRQSGVEALRTLLGKGVPFKEFLWNAFVANRDLKSPDQQAKLRADLRQAILRIENIDLRKTYLTYIFNRVYSDIQSKPSRLREQVGLRLDTAREHAEANLTDGYLQRDPHYFHSACVLALCLRHPELIDANMARLESLELPTVHDHQQILTTLLEIRAECGSDNPDLTPVLARHVGQRTLDRLLGLKQLTIHLEIIEPGHGEEAARLLDDVLSRLETMARSKDLVAAIDDKPADASCEHSAAQFFRLKASVHARLAADQATEDTVTLGHVAVSQDDLRRLDEEINASCPPGRANMRHPGSETSTRQAVPDDDMAALEAELCKA